MFKDLREKMNMPREKITDLKRETEIIFFKKETNKCKFYNWKISQGENSLECRWKTPEEKISELEGRSIKTIQT